MNLMRDMLDRECREYERQRALYEKFMRHTIEVIEKEAAAVLEQALRTGAAE